jgi:DNA-binding IclR family transcriptional regulator
MPRRAPAVERSVAILNHLAAHPGEKLTLSEIAREVGLNKATLHAILGALAESGYLVRDPGRKSYGLGPALIALGNAASSTQPAVDYALPEMKALTDELGLDCVASAPIHDEIVILARSGTPRPFGVYVLPGQRLPLAPPIGTVFVAWSQPEEIDHWLGLLGDDVRPEQLRRHRTSAEAVRKRGYSVGLEGAARSGRGGEGRPLTLEEGVRSVRSEEYAPVRLDPGETYRVNHIGAPVFGPDGGVAVALFVIGFPGRISGAEVARIAERLTAATERITKGIHGRPPE